MLEHNTKQLRWSKKMPNGTERYYSAEITEDLFDVIVFCTWGTKGTKLGGIKTYPAESNEHAEEILNGVIKRREKRGYTLSGDQVTNLLPL